MKRLFLLLAIVLFLSNFSAVIAQKDGFPYAKATFGVHNFLLLVKMFDGNLAMKAWNCTRFLDPKTLKTIGSDLQMEMIQSEKDFASFVKPMIVGKKMYYYYYLLPARKKLISTQSNLIFLNKDGAYGYFDLNKLEKETTKTFFSAFNSKGEKLWTTDVGDAEYFVPGVLNRPFLACGRICFSINTNLYVHDLNNGLPLFSFPLSLEVEGNHEYGFYKQNGNLLFVRFEVLNLKTGKIVTRRPNVQGSHVFLLEDGFLSCFEGNIITIRRFDLNGDLLWEKQIKELSAEERYNLEVEYMTDTHMILKKRITNEYSIIKIMTQIKSKINFRTCVVGCIMDSYLVLDKTHIAVYTINTVTILDTEDMKEENSRIIEPTIRLSYADQENILRVYGENNLNWYEEKILQTVSGKYTIKPLLMIKETILSKYSDLFASFGDGFVFSSKAQNKETKILICGKDVTEAKEIGKLGFECVLHSLNTYKNNIYALTSSKIENNYRIDLWRFDSTGCKLIKSWDEKQVSSQVYQSGSKIAFNLTGSMPNKLICFDLETNNFQWVDIVDETNSKFWKIDAFTNTEIVVKTYLYNHVYNMQKESLTKVDGKFLGVSYGRLVFLRDDQLVFIRDGVEDYVELQHEIDDRINPYIADDEYIVGKWIYDMNGKKIQPGMNLWSIYDEFPSKFDQKSINGKTLDLTRTKYVPQTEPAYSFGLKKLDNSSLVFEGEDEVLGKCWILHPKEKVFAFMLNDDDSLVLGREAALKANLFGKENAFFVSISNAFLDTSGFLYNQDLQKYVGTQIDTPQNQGIISCISFEP